MPLPQSAPMALARAARLDLKDKYWRNYTCASSWLSELQNLSNMAISYHIYMSQSEEESETCRQVSSLAQAMCLMLSGLDEDMLAEVPSISVHVTLPEQVKVANNATSRMLSLIQSVQPALWTEFATSFDKACYTLDFMRRATALIRFEPGQKKELDAVLHRMQGRFMDAHSMVRGAEVLRLGVETRALRVNLSTGSVESAEGAPSSTDCGQPTTRHAAESL